MSNRRPRSPLALSRPCLSTARRAIGRRTSLLLAPILCLALVTEAAALNMSVGELRIRNLGSYGFTSTNSQFRSESPGGNDHLYQMYGYLGNESGMVVIDGSSFDVVSAISASGATATSSLVLNANGAAALGLNAGDLEIDYEFVFVDDTSPADHDGIAWNIDVRNTTTAALAVSVYSYLDLDLERTHSDDIATASLDEMLIEDAVTGETFSWLTGSGGATHFQVGGYPSVRDQLDGWTTAGNLNDTAASFTGDFTGAFQFDLNVAASSSSGIDVVLAPEPSTAVLLGLGLAGLGHVSRRDRARSHRAA